MTVFRRIKYGLRSKRALSFPLVLSVMLAAVLIAAILYEFASSIYLTNGVKHSLERAALAVATDNVYNSYEGFREGGSAAEVYSLGIWEVQIDLKDVRRHLVEELGLQQSADGDLTKIDDNGLVLYSISNIDIQHHSETSMDPDNPIIYIINADVLIPFQLFHFTVPTTIPIETSSRFNPKF